MTVTNKHTPKQHNVSHLNTASLYPNLLPLSPSSQEIFFCQFFSVFSIFDSNKPDVAFFQIRRRPAVPDE